MQTRTSAGGAAWACLRSLRWPAQAKIASARSVSIFGGLRFDGTGAVIILPSLGGNRRPQRRHKVFLFCSYCEKRNPKSIFCFSVLRFFGKVVNVHSAIRLRTPETKRGAH